MDDRTWLQEFHERIWPPEYLRDVDPITHEELIQLCEIIERSEHVVQLYSYGPISGIGLALWQHEVYPDTGPEKFFGIIDDHIPEDARTWHERLLGVPAKEIKKRGQGCIRQDVWDLFSKFSHTAQNRKWLAKYNLEMHFKIGSYDY